MAKGDAILEPAMGKWALPDVPCCCCVHGYDVGCDLGIKSLQRCLRCFLLECAVGAGCACSYCPFSFRRGPQRKEKGNSETHAWVMHSHTKLLEPVHAF